MQPDSSASVSQHSSPQHRLVGPNETCSSISSSSSPSKDLDNNEVDPMQVDSSSRRSSQSVVNLSSVDALKENGCNISSDAELPPSSCLISVEGAVAKSMTSSPISCRETSVLGKSRKLSPRSITASSCASNPMPGERMSRTNLYIKGLPESFNDEQLWNLAPKPELIKSVKAATDDDLQCRGYGFIDFVTEEAANEAIQHIKQHQPSFTIKFAKENEKDKTNLYVTNLPKSWTTSDSDQLKGLFERFGTIQSAFVMVERVSNRSTGVGFVRFANESSALAALESIQRDPIMLPECCDPVEAKFADKHNPESRRRRYPLTGGSNSGHLFGYPQAIVDNFSSPTDSNAAAVEALLLHSASALQRCSAGHAATTSHHGTNLLAAAAAQIGTGQFTPSGVPHATAGSLLRASAPNGLTDALMVASVLNGGVGGTVGNSSCLLASPNQPQVNGVNHQLHPQQQPLIATNSGHSNLASGFVGNSFPIVGLPDQALLDQSLYGGCTYYGSDCLRLPPTANQYPPTGPIRHDPHSQQQQQMLAAAMAAASSMTTPNLLNQHAGTNLMNSTTTPAYFAPNPGQPTANNLSTLLAYQSLLGLHNHQSNGGGLITNGLDEGSTYNMSASTAPHLPSSLDSSSHCMFSTHLNNTTSFHQTSNYDPVQFNPLAPSEIVANSKDHDIASATNNNITVNNGDLGDNESALPGNTSYITEMDPVNDQSNNSDFQVNKCTTTNPPTNPQSCLTNLQPMAPSQPFQSQPLLVKGRQLDYLPLAFLQQPRNQSQLQPSLLQHHYNPLPNGSHANTVQMTSQPVNLTVLDRNGKQVQLFL